MKALKSVIITFLGFILTTVISICVMMYGWGLRPKSWFWIIGMGIFVQLFAYIIIAVGNHKS